MTFPRIFLAHSHLEIQEPFFTIYRPLCYLFTSPAPSTGAHLTLVTFQRNTKSL